MLLAGPSKGAGKGMQLGKAKKGASDFLDSLRAEGESIQVLHAPSFPPPSLPMCTAGS